MADKLAYIDNVKQRLTTVLNPGEVDLLGQYLKGIAEKNLTRIDPKNLLPKQPLPQNGKIVPPKK
jgi:hypothetical protein